MLYMILKKLSQKGRYTKYLEINRKGKYMNHYYKSNNFWNNNPFWNYFENTKYPTW